MSAKQEKKKRQFLKKQFGREVSQLARHTASQQVVAKLIKPKPRLLPQFVWKWLLGLLLEF